MMKLLTALTLASALMVLAMPSTAMAKEVELKQEMKCETSGYGQNSCWAKQSAQVLGRTHTIVNTGVDTTVLAATSAIAVAGLTAGVLKFKTRA